MLIEVPPRAADRVPGATAVIVAGRGRLPGVAIADLARVLLAVVRLVNGAAALAVPGVVARQIGVDPDTNPGALYVLRMFGIRTVLIGIELLVKRGEPRAAAVRQGILIHASDTLAAYVASLSGNFPRQSRYIVWISAFNTALAIIANREP